MVTSSCDIWYIKKTKKLYHQSDIFKIHYVNFLGYKVGDKE